MRTSLAGKGHGSRGVMSNTNQTAGTKAELVEIRVKISEVADRFVTNVKDTNLGQI